MSVDLTLVWFDSLHFELLFLDPAKKRERNKERKDDEIIFENKIK